MTSLEMLDWTTGLRLLEKEYNGRQVKSIAEFGCNEKALPDPLREYDGR